MATLAQLEEGLKRAYDAGNMEYARILAAEVVRARKDPANQIPDTQVPGTQGQKEERGIGDALIGAGEAGLSMVTGMTGGAIGTVGGAINGLGKAIVSNRFGTAEGANMIEQSAAEGAQALTYAPRTEAGQEYTGAIGETISNVIPPVMPMMAPLSGSAAGGAGAAQMAGAAAKRVAAPAVQRIEQAVQPIKTAMQNKRESFGAGSIGAAQVEAGNLRQAKANELPIPIQQTLGQRTRDFAQQQFERETAKDVTLGEPIRERMATQQKQMMQNLDAFVDATGAQETDLRSVGIRVNDALRAELAKAKARERVLYNDAKKSGEMLSPVEMQPLADYLNTNRAGRQSAPILNTIAESIKVQEVGRGNLANGSLIAGKATLEQAEEIRKTVNRFVKSNDPNDVRIATEIKAVIDDITAGAGGELYAKARAARAQRARDFENVALVSNLIGTKRGSADRAIALEDVVRKSVISDSTSLDQTMHLGRLLKKTPQGQQAWKELQGATVSYIRDQAYKGVSTDQAGNRIISPAQLNKAITGLDKSGKLDYMFGKKGAEQLRILNEVAQDTFTAPPGSVNTSGTSSAILNAVDTMATFGTTGIPVPAMKLLMEARNQMKNRVIKKRVDEALK